MITCNEIMTKTVVTCDRQDSLYDVARKMTVANVGSLPVVMDADSQELVGIVTDRDIVVRATSINLPADMTYAREVMSIDVHTCHPEDSVESAIAKMATHQVRRIPVVDSNNRVIGVIAQADIARYLDRQTTGVVVGEISEEKEPTKLVQ